MDIEFAPPKEKLKLTAYIFKYPMHFWLQALGGVVYNIIIIFGAIFLGKTIDAAALVHSGEASLSLFYVNLFSFLGFTIVFQLSRYLKRYHMRTLTNLVNCDLRAGLLASLFEMPINDLSHEKVGDMMSRMIGDVEQVTASVQITITELWDTIILMIAHFVACMVYSPKITLLASIPIPIVILLAQVIRTPLYSLSQKARKAASNINVHLQHNVSGVSLLRLFGLETADRLKFSKLLDEQLKWNISYSALQGSVTPLYILLATSGIILVVGLGGEYVINGIWTIGMFTGYLSLFSAMTVRTNMAGKVMNTWHGAKASWDRICEKLETPEKGEGHSNVSPTYVDSLPSLEVNSLSFRYPYTDENQISDISFTANKGEIIGVTGPVGSGKSALAAALSGLYPYEGEVFTGGVSLRELYDSRSSRIAYMDAEQFVFSDDVIFNVTLDRKDGDILDAITLASMNEDIETFENGLNTRLMERGVRISGGQRQRISLARAWYSDSNILLLDDPFSAIDVTMEQRIMKSIKEGIGSRTVVLFSHRLSTFDMTDKVLVIEKGSISQIGTHEELVSEDGLYKEIWQAQKFMEQGVAL